ncbi:MAG: DNA-binding protein, partial [Mycolicibacterium sp.]
PAGLDANHAAVLAALAVDADDLKAAAADVDTGVDLDDQATVAHLLAAVDNLVAEADAVAEAIHAAAVALVAGDEAALRQLKRTIRRYRRENADPRRLDISFTRGSDQAWSDTASDRSSSAGSSAVPDP